jgi:hypothetical protein
LLGSVVEGSYRWLDSFGSRVFFKENCDITNLEIKRKRKLLEFTLEKQKHSPKHPKFGVFSSKRTIYFFPK